MYHKKNYVAHIKALKQSLDCGLISEKVHRETEFSQKAWLKSYKDMNMELRKKTNDFERDVFKLMNNFVFEKTFENVRITEISNL